jgi:hypothetical protein
MNRALITVGLLMSAGIAILWIDPLPQREHVASHVSDNSMQSIEQEPRVCVSYPHALVRCGVASSEDFEAQRKIPLLREHYTDVGMVLPAILTTDEWDFASFRKNDGIVWTPVRILVRRGEVVFRDRSGNTIRGRCGNRLSQEPRTPVAFVMPPEMAHETPEIMFIEPPLSIGSTGTPGEILFPPLSPEPPFENQPQTPGQIPFERPLVPGLPFAEPAFSPLFSPPLPPIFPVLTGTPATPISNAPESGTDLLMLAGMAALLIFIRSMTSVHPCG